MMFCHDCPAGITVPGASRDRFGFPAQELQRSELYRVRLRSVVDMVRPARLWHGHFHHRYQAVLQGNGYRTVVDGLGKTVIRSTTTWWWSIWRSSALTDSVLRTARDQPILT